MLNTRIRWGDWLFGARPRGRISHDLRGEGLLYTLARKSLFLDFFPRGGGALYVSTLRSWNDGVPLDQRERHDVFRDILRGLRWCRPTICVRSDDARAAEWRALCDEFRDCIADVREYSDKKIEAEKRYVVVSALERGMGVRYNGAEIRSGEDLDNAFAGQRELPQTVRNATEVRSSPPAPAPGGSDALAAAVSRGPVGWVMVRLGQILQGTLWWPFYMATCGPFWEWASASSAAHARGSVILFSSPAGWENTDSIFMRLELPKLLLSQATTLEIQDTSELLGAQG